MSFRDTLCYVFCVLNKHSTGCLLTEYLLLHPWIKQFLPLTRTTGYISDSDGTFLFLSSKICSSVPMMGA